MRKAILFFLILITQYCKTEGPEYDEKYKTWTLLNYFVLTLPDAQAACVNSYKTAETCLKSASEFPLSPYTVNETTLITIISGSSSNATYSSYCSSLLAQTSFKNYTERAKECVMNCNKTFWQDRIDKSLCTEKFTTQLTASATDNTSCYTECLKTTNNNY